MRESSCSHESVRAGRRKADIAGLILAAFSTLLLALPSFVVAQVAPGPLTDPFFLNAQGATPPRFNGLERRAAIANQAVYNALLPRCTTQTGSCSGQVSQIFSNVRELVDTAQEILTGTDRAFGLNLDAEGLGFALRWTAAEELLAQGSMANDFANSQLGSLGSRISAIRIVSRASLAAAAFQEDEDAMVATNGSRRHGGGAASADQGDFSRLSFFFDGASGYGTKDPTALEDAFDFEGYEYTLGMDYRVTNGLVIGAIAGYSDRYVDFDGALSVVEGFIASKGFSALAFAQWDAPHFYATGSLGYQQLSYDIFRRISYPSFDPNVPSTNTATEASPDSGALLANINFGLPFEAGAFGFELYAKADYQKITIDGFTERPVAVAGNSGDGFQFRVAEQDVKSLDAALGVRLQYVWTPSFAVIIPFVRGELHRELEDQPRGLSTIYAGLPADVTAAAQQALVDFGLSSDVPDTQYYTLTAGVSAVLRGSSRVSSAGRGSGGLQAYLQYTSVRELANYKDTIIAGGLRYEF